MDIFFDTEFAENGKVIDLISIGMVREDGEEYYAVMRDGWGVSTCNDFVKENVLPFLYKDVPKNDKVRSVAAQEIVKFVGPKPTFWTYFGDYDWVALCQLYGTMIDLPTGWPMLSYDLRQLLDQSGHKDFHQPDSVHNALYDARWVYQTYYKLIVTGEV